MAIVFDEKFEANPGYDESWSNGESVGSGCTLDEDYATSNIGSPSGWDSQCLHGISTGSAGAYVRNVFSLSGKIFFRAYIRVHSYAMTSGQENRLLSTRNGANTLDVFVFKLYNDSGTLRVRMGFNYSGSTAYALSTNGLNLDQPYRVEVMYDITNGKFGWRVDGVDQSAAHGGNLQSGSATDLADFRLGVSVNPGSAPAVDVCFDNIAIDDADWVGPVASATPQSVTGSMPAAAGVLTPRGIHQYQKSVTGSMPAASGVLTPRGILQLRKSLAGFLPGPGGALTAALLHLYHQSAAGDMPAASGVLTPRGIHQYSKAVSGNMDAPSGDVATSVSDKYEALDGDVPAPTGNVSLHHSYLVSVTGTFGDIVADVSPAIALNSGRLTKKIFKLPSGSMPAPSGAMTKSMFKKLFGAIDEIASASLTNVYSGATTFVKSIQGTFGAMTGSVSLRRISTGASKVWKIIGSSFKKLLSG